MPSLNDDEIRTVGADEGTRAEMDTDQDDVDTDSDDSDSDSDTVDPS